MGTGFQILIRGLGWVILLAGLTLSGGLPLAQAGTWVYQKIADDQMFDPQSVNGAIRFSSFGEQPAISGDTVYFFGRSDRAGLRSWSPTTGIVNQLVTGDLLPDGQSSFTGIDPAFAFDDDDFAFLGQSGNQQGIYARVGGQLRGIADLNTPIPSGSGNFSGFVDALGRRSLSVLGEEVAFVGNGLDGQRGIFLSNSTGLQVIADRNSTIPGLGVNFHSFSDPWIANDRIVFTGYAAPGPFGGGINGIFEWTPSLGIQALFTTLNPNPRAELAALPFSYLVGAQATETRTLFLGTSGTSYSGILSLDGSAEVLLDFLNGYVGRDNQRHGGNPILYAVDGSEIVSAVADSGDVIVWSDGGDWTQVLGPGDVLDGRPVLRDPDPLTEWAHEFRLGPSGFANDSLAFYSRVLVAVGSGPGVAIVREGVYLTIQVPEAATLQLVAAALIGLLTAIGRLGWR